MILAVLLFPAFVPPAPVLPPYVAPLAVMDDVLHLPAPEPPQVSAGSVCYAGPAHLRLTVALQLGESLSNERARVAWLMGWQSAAEIGAVALEKEQAAHDVSDSERSDLDARLRTAEASRWSATELLGILAGTFIVGGLLGAGAYAWDAK
jgi:hypothetical protein